MPKKGDQETEHSETHPCHDSLDAETFAKICKALGHPTRIKIMDYLKQTDKCICGKIVGMLPLAQSTVSQHLKHPEGGGSDYG